MPMNHPMIALSLAAALSAIPFSTVRATPPGSGAPAAVRMDDDYHHYPHMHRALDRLREARSELDQAEDIFKGHKAEAEDHVDRAIEQVKTGLEEQGEKTDAAVGSPAANKLDDDHYPHLHHALDALNHARDELQSAEDIFKGHRDAALDQVDRAIHQIEDAIREG
jgi:hypothetical protein